MSKYVVDESSLTAIGDAIREKTGGTELIPLTNMPAEIASISSGGGGVEVEPIVLSGRCDYGCSGAMSGNYIKLFGNTVSTKDISSAKYMFYKNSAEEIPFDINLNSSSSSMSLEYMFHVAKKLKYIPKIKAPNGQKISSIGSIFRDCNNIRTIPEDIADNWDLSNINSDSWTDISYIFQNCYSLRNIPENLLKKLYSSGTSRSYQVFAYSFGGCYALDEIKGLPVPTISITRDIFDTYFPSRDCFRVKDITFSLNDDGSVKTANWKNQTINLSDSVGYGYQSSYDPTAIILYNSGITADKEVSDDATYQALKDDPDWYALKAAYSRYNHDSAVRTINSLPDTSAYLTANGGTNTIKFKGAAGSKTDGGAINTLTEEEIAVATAKGWTVTLV